MQRSQRPTTKSASASSTKSSKQTKPKSRNQRPLSTTPRKPPTSPIPRSLAAPSLNAPPSTTSSARITTLSAKLPQSPPSSIPTVTLDGSSPLFHFIHSNLSSHIQQHASLPPFPTINHPHRQFSTKPPPTDPTQDLNAQNLDQLEDSAKFDEILSKVIIKSEKVLQSNQEQLEKELSQVNKLKQPKLDQPPAPPAHITQPIKPLTSPIPIITASLDESVQSILNKPAPKAHLDVPEPLPTVKIHLQNDGNDDADFESLLRNAQTPTSSHPQHSQASSSTQKPAQSKPVPKPTPAKPFSQTRTSAQSSELHAQLTNNISPASAPSAKPTDDAAKSSFMAQFQGYVDQIDEEEIKGGPNSAKYRQNLEEEKLQQKIKQQQEQAGLFGSKMATITEDISTKPSPFANRKMANILGLHKIKRKDGEALDQYQGSFGRSIAAAVFFGASSLITANLCWWQINRRWWKLALIAAREDAIFADPMLLQDLTDLVTEVLVEHDMYEFGSDLPGSPIRPPIDHEAAPTVRQIFAQKSKALQDLVAKIIDGTFDGSAITHRSGTTLKPTPPLKLDPGENPQDLAELVYHKQHAPLYPTDLVGNPIDIPATELFKQVSMDNILDAVSYFKEHSQFHNVTAHGQFDYTREMYVGPAIPPIDGAFKNVEVQKGFFVITPLQLYDPIQVNIPVADNNGVHKINLKMVLHHVLVNRGWVPQHLIQTYHSSPITEHELYSNEDLQTFDRLIRRKYDQSPQDSNPFPGPPFPDYINYLPDAPKSETNQASANWSLSSLLGENHPMDSQQKSDLTKPAPTAAKPDDAPTNAPKVTQYSIDYSPNRDSSGIDKAALAPLLSKLPAPTQHQLDANQAWYDETTSRVIYQEHGMNKVKLDRLGLTMNDLFKVSRDSPVPFSLVSDRQGPLNTPLQPVNGVMHYGATYDLYSHADQTAKIKIRGTEVDAFTFLTGPKFAVNMGVAPSTMHFPTDKTISLLSRDQMTSSGSEAILSIHLPVPVIDSNDPVPARLVVPVPSEAQHFDSIRLGLKRKSVDDHILFKTMPATHAGYAVTWGSFAGIGAYLTAIQFKKPIVQNTIKEYFAGAFASFSSASKANKPKSAAAVPVDSQSTPPPSPPSQ